jgi:hypothetical protein
MDLISQNHLLLNVNLIYNYKMLYLNIHFLILYCTILLFFNIFKYSINEIEIIGISTKYRNKYLGANE